MKYFVCSDPHGFYTIMKKAIDEAGFDEKNPDHKLIIVGDAVDRGDEPIEMIKYINRLHKRNKLIFVLGNHEDLFPECYYQYKSGWGVSSHHIHNGTLATVKTLGPVYCKQWLNFTAKYGKEYFETKNHIFTHGWIPVKREWDDYTNWFEAKYTPVFKEDWREADHDEWEEARWLNGQAYNHVGLNKTGKTIVVGHIHSSYGHCNFENDGVEYLSRIETFYTDPDTGRQEPHVNYEPFIEPGIIALDACTVMSHKVNVVVIDDEEI